MPDIEFFACIGFIGFIEFIVFIESIGFVALVKFALLVFREEFNWVKVGCTGGAS